MKVIDGERFRCDLCGAFKLWGVAETQPEAEQATKVCSDCTTTALDLLLRHVAKQMKG